MTEYEIKLSNDAVYRVTGPDGATENQLMEAVSGQLDPTDLSVARSKNDAFGAFLRNKAREPVKDESEKEQFRRQFGEVGRPDVGAGEGSLRAGFQGLTFGAGDEIVAGGAAAVDALRGQPLGESFDQRLENERRKLEAFREDSPGLAIGSEIAGALPTAAVPFVGGPRLAAGAGLLGRSAAGAGAGAAGGAAFGFNAGEGGFQNRAKNAALTAALSAPLGAALPAVGAGAKNLFDRTLGVGRAARQAGVTKPAFDVLSDLVEADSAGSGARIAAAGPNATLADAGRSTAAAVDFLGQRPGPSQGIVRKALGERVTRAARDVGKAINTAFGRPAGIRTVETGLRRGTARARQDAYDVAYSRAIDYTDEIGRDIEGIISDRVPKAAIKKANSLMRAEGQSSKQLKFNVAEDGTLVFAGELPDVRQIDYITRALNDVADQEIGKGKIGGTTNLGRVFGNLSRELRSLTREAVPEYGVALDTAAQPIAARNALKIGQKALSLRMTRDELSDTISGMSIAEKSYVAQGIRSQIDETLSNVKKAFTDPNLDAREAAKALKDLSSRASREKISLVIGDDSASGLFKNLDEATASFELNAAAAENSKTAVRTMFNERVGGAQEGILETARRGRPVDATREMVAALLGRSEADLQRMGDKTAADLATALLQKNPQGLTSQIQKAQTTLGPRSDNAARLAEQLLLLNPAVTGPGVRNR